MTVYVDPDRKAVERGKPRPCNTCWYLRAGNDGIGTAYCAHPNRERIFPYTNGKRKHGEREIGACGPDGKHWESA